MEKQSTSFIEEFSWVEFKEFVKNSESDDIYIMEESASLLKKLKQHGREKAYYIIIARIHDKYGELIDTNNTIIYLENIEGRGSSLLQAENVYN